MNAWLKTIVYLCLTLAIQQQAMQKNTINLEDKCATSPEPNDFHFPFFDEFSTSADINNQLNQMRLAQIPILYELAQQYVDQAHNTLAVPFDEFSTSAENNTTSSKKIALAKNKKKQQPICEVCNKVFYSLSNLNKHMRIHTDQRPYECTYCDKSFYQKDNLEIHIRKHTGDKPYACTYCTRSFAHKSNLNTHLNTHTKEKSYPCNQCGKVLSSHSSLCRHKKIHKKNQLENAIT